MGVAHTVAMVLAIAAWFIVVGIYNKIKNPSPPPPSEGEGSNSDQAKHGPVTSAPRGVVDHDWGRIGYDDHEGRKSWEGTYVPSEPPDIIQATRVGWYEDDPEQPERTHIHWVNRADWEGSQRGKGEKPVPRWARWLGI